MLYRFGAVNGAKTSKQPMVVGVAREKRVKTAGFY